MVNSFKNTWWVILLVAVGGIFFFLSLHANKPQNDQGVVLKDIFPASTAPQKTDPVPPLAIVTSPVNGHETGISIQVYSFQDRNRAENALQTLKKSGYQAGMIMSDLGEKGTFYRVRVGGIPDEVAAHKMLEQIRKDYNSGFIVTK